MTLLARPIARRTSLFLVSLAIAAIAALAAAACTSGPSGTSTPTQPATWIDQPVTFTADGMTIYGTYRHPVGVTRRVAAALLIAGSGPTDRNGNSAAEPGPIDTLKTLAGWLSADGVASLRYDKLGSGQTGLGPYAAAPTTIGIAPFEDEAVAAFKFLASQPAVNANRLAVIGHSEGALFALMLATGTSGSSPPVHALGLLEPLSLRYLDVISAQVQASVAAAQSTGSISPTSAATVDSALAAAISTLRKNGTVTTGLPASLASIFNPSTALFLSQADRFDPGQLAARVAQHLPVLLTCSDADIHVTCAEVDHLNAGLTLASADVSFVHLSGVDHVLKQDPGGSATNYTKPLPFSPQLQAALRVFVGQHL